MLKDHLPHRYQADRAFVIDSRGSCSEQIDIVIYDRQYSPLLYNQANQRYVPAESVYAVLEVKQDLSRGHVRYAGKRRRLSGAGDILRAAIIARLLQEEEDHRIEDMLSNSANAVGLVSMAQAVVRCWLTRSSTADYFGDFVTKAAGVISGPC